MADESKVLIRMRLIGAALVQRGTKTVGDGFRYVDRTAKGAARGLRSINGGRVQSAMAKIQRGATGAARGISGLTRTLSLYAAAAAAAAGVGFGAGVAQAVDFEQQMANVQARLLVGGKEMGRLNELALRLGANTQFSAGEAAQAMDELAAQGFNVRQIFGTLPGTLSLAASSSTDLAQAAEIQTNTLHGFGLAADQAGRVADVLAMTANRSAADVTDLGETFSYVAATARVTGSSLEEISAATGLLANVGIKGSRAGTALRTSLLRLTDPTLRMKDRLASMGLEASQLAAVPLPKVLGLVAQGLKRLPTRGEKVGAVSAIFGKEAAPSMINLLELGRRKIDRLADALGRSKGSAKQAAGIMRNTVSGAFDNLTGSIETAAIRLTQRFMPALKRGLNRAAEGVNDFTAGLATGSTTVTVKRRIKDEGGGMRTVRTTEQASGAQRAGATVRSVIGDVVSGAQDLARKAMPVVRDVVRQVVDAIKPAAPFLENVLLPLLQGIGEGVIGGVVAAFKLAVPIVKTAATVLGWIGEKAEPLQGLFRGIGRIIGFVFGGAILKSVVAIGSAFGKAGGVIGFFGKALATAGRIALAPLKLLVGAAKGVVKGIGWMVRAVGTVGRAFGRGVTFVRRYVGFLTGLPGRVGRAAINMVGSFVNGVAKLPAAAQRIVTKVLDKVGTLPGKLFDLGKKAAGKVGSGIAGAATAVATAAYDLGEKIVDKIVEAIKSAPGAVTDAIKSVVPGPVRDAIGMGGDLLGIDKVGSVSGGIDPTAATGGTIKRSGWAIVGERGPELARLPGGTKVYDHQQTARALQPRRRRRPAEVLSAAAAPLFANITLASDFGVIHNGLYRLERRREESR